MNFTLLFRDHYYNINQIVSNEAANGKVILL